MPAPPWSATPSSSSTFDLGLCCHFSFLLFPPLLPVQCFCPFLNMFSLRHRHGGWLWGSAVPCSGSVRAGIGCSWLRAAPAPPQGGRLTAPHCQNPGHQRQVSTRSILSKLLDFLKEKSSGKKKTQGEC